MHTSPPAGPSQRLPALTCALAATAALFAAPALAVTVSTSSLASGTLGVGYADTVAAADATPPVVWTIADGSLPAGLSLDAGSGAISGIPGAIGTSAFVVLATDALSDTASRALSITIDGVPAAITDLSATRLTSGNDADGTSRLQLAFTPTTYAATAEVYRAPLAAIRNTTTPAGSCRPRPATRPGRRGC
jgi:hypothetical protein